jgi:hypothetical protein
MLEMPDREQGRVETPLLLLASPRDTQAGSVNAPIDVV